MRSVSKNARIFILLAAFSLGLSSTSEARDAGPSLVVAESISRGLNLGQAQEVIIEFADSAIQAEAARLRTAAMPDIDPPEALALKATRFRELKQHVADSLDMTDIEVTRDYSHLPMTALKVHSAAALKRLLARPEIVAIHENVAHSPSLAQSLPIIGQPTVAAAGFSGIGTTVAVLDSGTDYTRPAFGSCSAPGGSCRVVVALDFAPDDGVLDGVGLHGTNVAGIVLGVAPSAKIAALDVFSADGYAHSANLVAAINWSIANRATYNIVAMNLSLGADDRNTSPCPGNYAETPFANARAAGIVPVVSAGNEKFIDGLASPACAPSAVSVGATYDSNVGGQVYVEAGCTDAETFADKVTCFSNSASFLTLFAPGAIINAAGISKSGTSMAAPHVAGAAAILRSHYPNESVDQTVERLTAYGDPILDARNGLQKPRLNLPRSLHVLPTAPVIGTAILGDNGIIVNFSPQYLGSGRLVDYFAHCGNEFNGFASGVGSPITISGLTPGRSYTCTVSTQTTVGYSQPSAASNAVTVFGPEDSFPPGGSMPLGWTTNPVGSAAPWVVTNDSAYGGTLSLRSGTIQQGQQSTLSYTGTFTDGMVSFARKMSGQRDWDYMTFYIDGSPVRLPYPYSGISQWTGEMSWREWSFPITAGTHTLSWKYWKGSSYATTSEGAWIDSVTMPTVGMPPSPPIIGTAIADEHSIRVAFTPGALGSGTLVNYTARCGDSNSFTGSGSPIVVEGLSTDRSYSCQVKTVTTFGSSDWSAPSNAVTPTVFPVIPAPTIGTATAGNASISVAFTSSDNGEYLAMCGQILAYGTSSPITVTGLVNGTTYTCRVSVRVRIGAIAEWSAPSNAVTPRLPPDEGFPVVSWNTSRPPGWINPVGSNASWAVTSDASYAGPLSLKSGSIGNGQISELSYAGAFSAGNVSFARKVSSEANYDYLEFYIDGVLKNRWSGEQAWTVVSFPITAGSHTLLWRYMKDGSLVSGGDAAWIDSVTIPAAGTSNAGATVVGAGDFNADGKDDILVYHPTDKWVSGWLMNGLTRTGSQVVGTFSIDGWDVVGSGDFNGDGKGDILFYHPINRNVGVWLMDGTTRIGAGIVGTFNLPGWVMVGAGDFNGDGKADILFHHPANNVVGVWLMNGLTRIGAGNVGSFNTTGWNVVGAGDFNGDGKADILAYHPTNRSVVVWLMNGLTRTSSQGVGSFSLNGWEVVGSGDFNGDGKADILFYHPINRNVGVWLMDGATRIGAAIVGTFNLAGWRMVGAGDFNGDGKADILFHHPANNVVGAWLMNGLNRIGTGNISP